jgi:TolB protein
MIALTEMSSKRLVGAGIAVAFAAAALALAFVVLRGNEQDDVAGDLIAYGCKEPKIRWYAICVIKTDGTGQRRLTKKLETTDPVWSPDGRRIVFTRNEDIGDSTLFTSDDIFVIDADGGSVKRLTPETVGQSSGQPSWSADGTQIVYVHGMSVNSAVPSRFGGLFVMNDDGGDVRRLTTGRTDNDPSWSPDGREIVYAHGENLSSPEDSNTDVYVVSAGGGPPRALTQTPMLEWGPVWSPDGSKIAFMSTTNLSPFGISKMNVEVMNRDGTGRRRVLTYDFLGSPRRLSWSPDATSLAVETTSDAGCAELSLLDLASGRLRKLAPCTRPREEAVSPNWQPDQQDDSSS